MQMYIPSGFIIPLFIVSFLLLSYQYYQIDPDRRVLNLRFGLMVIAVGLIFAVVMLHDQSLSMIFFLLALLWLGLSIYLLRRVLNRPKH